MITRHFCKPNFIQKCTCFFFLMQAFNAYANPIWHLYKNEKGVSVYYQIHDDDTFEVKGELVVNGVTTEDFLALLSDTQVAQKWIENASKVSVIKILSPSENLVYSYFDSPWPVANRDAVTYSCYSQLTPNQSQLVIKARPKELPLYKNVVRIKTLNAKWLLTQQGNNLSIAYQVYALSAGMIPTWLNNKVGLKSTYKTLLNLHDILIHQRYQVKAPLIKAGKC
ncbi:START domain-containing protein [Pseudoalteromonas fuliginea]|uniref:START domain-containing protein n=1 Tax=Pseudoalteromonas fuliginea TaxID=1872678 RepID=UPI0009DDA5D7|nr:START domain-containing protein [Pseudoalteromonas fuliginea]